MSCEPVWIRTRTTPIIRASMSHLRGDDFATPPLSLTDGSSVASRLDGSSHPSAATAGPPCPPAFSPAKTHGIWSPRRSRDQLEREEGRLLPELVASVVEGAPGLGGAPDPFTLNPKPGRTSISNASKQCIMFQ